MKLTFTYPSITSNRMIKKFGLLVSALFLSSLVFSQQQVYDDFEGSKLLMYGSRNGVLDTLMKNPAPDKVNSSEKCAMYVRNASKKFDNIKMTPTGKLTDVSPFATYVGIPPKIKMKIYTSAPVGTLVEVLLGSKGRNNEYPAGTNSQYQAYTTVTNQWEELEFKFSQIPQGSETSTVQVDQITLLFNPNSTNSDKYYFDDLTGPAMEKTEAVAPPEKSNDEKKDDKNVPQEKTKEKVKPKTNTTTKTK